MKKGLVEKYPVLWIGVIILFPLIFSILIPVAVFQSILSTVITNKKISAWLAIFLAILFLGWIIHDTAKGRHMSFYDQGCIGFSGNLSEC